MTARQVWEGMLTELSKANAPSLLLHEFNYYFNKAINLYINKRYNIYDINLLTTDDLRVLKATTILTPLPYNNYNASQRFAAGKAKLFDATYEVILPGDYLHLLNCICIYRLDADDKCYNKDDYVHVPAQRLTSDAWSIVINDYYHRPLPWRPYYYIHNVNLYETEPTNPVSEDFSKGTDLRLEFKVEPNGSVTTTKITWYNKYASEDGNTLTTSPTVYYIVENGIVYKTVSTDKYTILTDTSGVKQKATYTKAYSTPNTDRETHNIGDPIKLSELILEKNSTTTPNTAISQSNFPRTITLGNPDNRTVSLTNKPAGLRHSNSSSVRCEIRYGNDKSVYVLEGVLIDYIKSPQVIRLTKEQVDLTQDTSQIMEFPDYVCQEIINELTQLVMARDADPRFNIQQAVTLSIANPAQALAPQQQLQARQLQA